MPAGVIDLDVRYLDAVSGEGVAVETIHGVVKNSLGVVIEEITPVAETDLSGVIYYARDYDVRNGAKFPGLFLTVDWVAVRYGTVLPTFSKRYDYRPVTVEAASATVMQWDPSTDPLVMFYEINRTRAGETAPTYVGRSFGPFFVDRTVFPNEFEARSWNYTATPFARTPGTLQADGSDYRALGTQSSPLRIWRSSAAVCMVSGKVTDITGGSGVAFYADRKWPEVIFAVHPRATQQLVGDKYLMPEDVSARVALDGSFTVILLQDTIVEFRVSCTYFRGRFVVPRRESATIGDVGIEIIRDY